MSDIFNREASEISIPNTEVILGDSSETTKILVGGVKMIGATKVDIHINSEELVNTATITVLLKSDSLYKAAGCKSETCNQNVNIESFHGLLEKSNQDLAVSLETRKKEHEAVLGELRARKSETVYARDYDNPTPWEEKARVQKLVDKVLFATKPILREVRNRRAKWKYV